MTVGISTLSLDFAIGPSSLYHWCQSVGPDSQQTPRTLVPGLRLGFDASNESQVAKVSRLLKTSGQARADQIRSGATRLNLISRFKSGGIRKAGTVGKLCFSRTAEAEADPV